MKKIKFLTVLVVTIFATVLLAGCNRDQHELVGDWNWEDAGILFYTFNDDGTGIMVGEEFAWTTSSNILTITIDGTPMVWEYLVSGNRLTLISAESHDLVFHYVR